MDVVRCAQGMRRIASVPEDAMDVVRCAQVMRRIASGARRVSSDS